MERLTEKRDGQNVIPLRQNGKIKWAICSAGLGDAPTKYLYGDHADLLASIEDIMGDDYDLDRLRELVEADREGRCVVLPCKPSGVTVYQLRGKKHAKGRGISPRHVGCATVWTGGHYQLEHQGAEPCRDCDFGKTWFLEPEAAEAALKGDQHGQDL